MRAAAVQLNSTSDRDRNLEAAERLVRAAAEEGAELVVLPEKWTVLGDAEALEAGAELLEGSSIAAARGWARELGIDLVAGSFAERAPGSEKLANTSVLIDREGEIGAVYRKIHMFDVDVGGVAYRESDSERAGDDVVVVNAGAVSLGLTVCYDLRFPELYRILAIRGARVITIPAAFTKVTGQAHWEILLRARAIENQCYVVAAAQGGTHENGRRTFGHSLVVDPWGEVVACRSEDGEGVVIAEVSRERIAGVRRQLPALEHRLDF